MTHLHLHLSLLFHIHPFQTLLVLFYPSCSVILRMRWNRPSVPELWLVNYKCLLAQTLSARLPSRLLFSRGGKLSVSGQEQQNTSHTVIPTCAHRWRHVCLWVSRCNFFVYLNVCEYVSLKMMCICSVELQVLGSQTVLHFTVVSHHYPLLFYKEKFLKRRTNKHSQLETNLMMHNNFSNSLSFFKIGALLQAWLQRAQTVENSRGWVRVALFPATISGPDNQDLLAKHPDN